MMLGRVPVEPDALAARAESEGAVTQMRKDGGFTLVELMVVVAILAVLTMVAITSYKYYIRRARSEEGKAMLMEIKMKQEHFFSTYSYYMSSAANENSLYPAATQNPKTSSGSSDKTMYDWSKMNCAAPAAGEVGWCNLGFRPQGPTDKSVWVDMGTLPMNNFVDVSTDGVGLGFLTDSIGEYEVLDNEERTVALSLLRAVRNWIATEIRSGSGFPSQKGGQCLGRHEIRYAIMPHKGNWQDANIPLAGELFNVPVRPVQTGAHRGVLSGKQGSFFEVDNAGLRFSTIKKPEGKGGFIVRLYNPTSRTQTGTLKFATELKCAWYTNLNEERQSELPLKDANTVSVTAEAYKIVTIEIQPEH